VYTVDMRLLVLVVGIAAACGGSDKPEPAPPAFQPLPSVPLASNEEPRPARLPPRPPPPPRRVEPPPAAPSKPAPPEPVDGVYVPAYIKVNGMKLLDQRITVKGTVVWIYDCVEDVAAQQPDKSREEIKTLVTRKPQLCKRPHFLLGDRKTTPVDRAIMVAEVPRPIRADERISLPKDQVAAWPEVPSLAVGQEIKVEGTWALNSPKGFANRDGLLVYGRLVP
jgi:hypothetical protein